MDLIHLAKDLKTDQILINIHKNEIQNRDQSHLKLQKFHFYF